MTTILVLLVIDGAGAAEWEWFDDKWNLSDDRVGPTRLDQFMQQTRNFQPA
jgi:hypothetical protein